MPPYFRRQAPSLIAGCLDGRNQRVLHEWFHNRISDIYALPDFLLARKIEENRPTLLRENLNVMPATPIRLPQPCAVRDPHQKSWEQFFLQTLANLASCR